MRYRLDANGYVESVFWGCYSNGCAEYTGTIPNGYTDLNDWSENALINAYYLVDGNLVLDAEKLADLEAKIEQDSIDNEPLYRKDLYGTTDTLNGTYTNETAKGEVLALTNVKRINPKVKITNIDCYKSSKVDIVTQGKNMLKNDAITETIAGVTFTRLINGGIKISGTATADIEYNLSGSSTNTTSLFALKPNKDYYLNIGDLDCELKYYDGTTSQVYTGASGVINLSENKEVTQVLIKIPSGTTIEQTIYPMLEYGTSASEYEEYKHRILTIDFSEYISEDALFPSDNLYPSDDLFPKGTTICIYIENGSVYISVNGVQKYLMKANVNLFDGFNTVYTMQDTKVEMTYCINNLKLEGTVTKNNNFKILEDGSIEAHNGYFSGTIIADSGDIGGFALLPEEFKSTSSITRNYTESDLTRIQNLVLGNIEATDEDYEKYDLNGDNNFSSLDMLRVRQIVKGTSSPIQTSYFSINSNDPVHCLTIKNSETDSNGVSLGLYGGYISELGVKQLSSTNDNCKLLASGYQVQLTDYENNNTTDITPSGITTPTLTQTSLVEQKKNFEKFENALPILNDIDIYKYNLKFEEDGHKKHIGFVIGEDYNYSSEITAIDKDGKEIGVDNYSMTSLCLQAIKELCNKVETLEKRIKEMEEK